METTKQKMTTSGYILGGLAVLLLATSFFLVIRTKNVSKDLKETKEILSEATLVNDELLNENATLKTENETLNNKVDSLNKNIEGLRGLSLELRKEVNTLNSEFETLLTEHTTLKNKIEENAKKGTLSSLFSKKNGNLDIANTTDEDLLGSDTEAIKTEKKFKFRNLLPWNWRKKK